MKTIFPDSQLEFELQELYILSKHWMQDISFIEDEIQFLKNIFDKYSSAESINKSVYTSSEFNQKIIKQEANINSLKKYVSEYLKFLEPFINDINRKIELNLIEKFNKLEGKIKGLFASVKQTKRELFADVLDL